jgi:hypothetical protein
LTAEGNAMKATNEERLSYMIALAAAGGGKVKYPGLGAICPACEGAGMLNNRICERCGGRGYVRPTMSKKGETQND